MKLPFLVRLPTGGRFSSTRNIRKPGFEGNLNIITFTQSINDLISRSFEIPASAYYHPLPENHLLNINFQQFSNSVH